MDAEIALKPIPGHLSTTALHLNPRLSFEEWESVGQTIKDIANGSLWWVGDWLLYGEQNFNERAYQAVCDETGYEHESVKVAAWVADRFDPVTRVTELSWSHHRAVASLESPEERSLWLDAALKEKWSVRDLREQLRQSRQRALRPADAISGTYQTIVIDPPWQMEKIEREVRPRQHGFDYPTMSEEELQTFPLPDIAAADCHLYLWTTHKHLPLALRLAEHWGFNYECLLTWRKNVGFTPYSWMRSTEHVLFCRKGNLQLLKLGLRLDFEAKVREHSRKPDEFYNLIKEVSPGPRIDVFSREKREGFDQWGNETDKFEEVA